MLRSNVSTSYPNMVISWSSHDSRPVTRSHSNVPMPAASIASPQRMRSPSYRRTNAESSSSVTTESASWRSVATSVSDHSRGSGPNTQRAPMARPPWPVSGIPR
jgi:hypothetical protein